MQSLNAMRLARLSTVVLLVFAWITHANASIVVTYDGPPGEFTCTLAQAINAANAANGVDPASYGSRTPAGYCPIPAVGPNVIAVYIPSVTLTQIDNYWYGANALPPIASTISLWAIGQVTTIRAVHAGDPAPNTADAFRLFYVSGGWELPAGSLTVVNAVLQGGYAKGGDSGSGGGGAGMGGAIFNQGTLVLRNVSLLANSAVGGSAKASLTSAGGGGMGQDGGDFDGGGFGGSLGGIYGGAGGVATAGGGAGGGGFLDGSAGAPNYGKGGGAGGGNGGLGGPAPGVPGDGGSGGTADSFSLSGNGGNFGQGGVGGGSGGGGGIGGGGGGTAGIFGAGGQGGFGGGAGGPSYDGAFGGFGGGGNGAGLSGFGGGNDPSLAATGGAGMGGAIFNHAGTVSLANVTATGNSASGGACIAAGCSGSGLGAAVFNLNGSVTIDFSTLAGNLLAGNNARTDASGPEDGSVYSLAYGNKVEDGTASIATLTVHNSIIHGTHADGGLQSDITVNRVDGANANTSSLVFSGKNLVGQTYVTGGANQSGILPSSSDPLLGALSFYPGQSGINSNSTPVLPIAANSAAYNAAPNCLLADNVTTLASDGRAAARPYANECDVGAYEYDGDYIFANGSEPLP